MIICIIQKETVSNLNALGVILKLWDKFVLVWRHFRGIWAFLKNCYLTMICAVLVHLLLLGRSEAGSELRRPPRSRFKGSNNFSIFRNI